MSITTGNIKNDYDLLSPCSTACNGQRPGRNNIYYVSAVQSQALTRTLCVSNVKFHIWEGESLRGHLYSSDYKKLSVHEEQKICEHLKISFELAWFSVTHETVDSLQLPARPTFTNEDGRKFWL